MKEANSTEINARRLDEDSLHTFLNWSRPTDMSATPRCRAIDSAQADRIASRRGGEPMDTSSRGLDDADFLAAAHYAPLSADAT